MRPAPSLRRAAFAALPLPDDDDDDDAQSSPEAIREKRSQARHDTAGDVAVLEWVAYDREAIDERVAHVRRMMHSASSSQPDMSAAWLTGFDASRPDAHTALSVVPRIPSIHRELPPPSGLAAWHGLLQGL
ncbi:hypothetical protein MGU_02821 [Metarhizium guizhouense ARSEF 977]|uniref:Uncharacterized protein n=1 Tax=Metarhizium guizhouense (strain ARSEF 977) TaxID=1276136 RepID=A0A0B4HJP2_METGA|nr:hypothetical protein MGU_02821 [Metarhizium guizhouense ARSEF 977]